MICLDTLYYTEFTPSCLHCFKFSSYFHVMDTPGVHPASCSSPLLNICMAGTLKREKTCLLQSRVTSASYNDLRYFVKKKKKNLMGLIREGVKKNKKNGIFQIEWGVLRGVNFQLKKNKKKMLL